MKTVVTGGAGFIGSNLVRKLLDQGREVIIADEFSRGRARNLADLQIKPSDVGSKTSFKKIDLKDFQQAKKVTAGADSVFHLAARIGNITYLHNNYDDELQALLANLTIDASVFRACLENSVKKLVFASSAAVYPIDAQNKSYDVVISEDMLTSRDPDGGYGWAKLMGEIELQWMRGIDIGIARIFNVYGENSHTGGNSHVVIDLMKKVLLDPNQQIIVWGDGKQSRDFLHVSDCVDALIKLEEKNTKPPMIVNIGSGVPTTICVLAQKIVELSGQKMQIVYDISKPVGPLSRTADTTRAQTKLEWKPRIGLDEGLRRTFNWLIKRLKSGY